MTLGLYEMNYPEVGLSIVRPMDRELDLIPMARLTPY